MQIRDKKTMKGHSDLVRVLKTKGRLHIISKRKLIKFLAPSTTRFFALTKGQLNSE